MAPHSSVHANFDRQLDVLSTETTTFKVADIIGAIAHLRGGIVSLPTELAKLGDYTKCRTLEIYADVLVFEGAWQLPVDIDELGIYARMIMPAAGVSVSIRISSRLDLSLYCREVVGGLSIETPNRVAIPVKRHQDAAGSFLSVASDWKFTEELLPRPPLAYLNGPSVVDEIADNERMAQAGLDRFNRNLVRLLQYQLLLATTYQDRQPAMAYECAAYVARMTAGTADALDLYARASGLVAVMVSTDPESMTAIVPQQAILQAQSILQSRLQAAAVLETAFQSFREQEANSANVVLMANVTLGAAIDGEELYNFQASVLQKRYDEARDALKNAQEHFRVLELQIPGQQKRFREGIEAFRTKATIKAVFNGLIAVVTAAGAIAACCVAPPAGAAGIAVAASEGAKVMEGVEGATKAATTIQKLAHVVEKLADGLEKIEKVVKAIAETIEAMHGLHNVKDAAKSTVEKLSIPVSKGDDSINASADWDAFSSHMQSLFDSLKENDIDGAREFFDLMAEMGIRAKAVLAAQQAVSIAGDAYAIAYLQRLQQERQVERVQQAIPNIKNNPKALRLMKLHMFERLLALRTSITLDFRQYVGAFAWQALTSHIPIKIDPLKSIAAMSADACTLQAAIGQVGAANRSQYRTFVFSTKGPGYIAASHAHPGGLSSDILSSIKSTRRGRFSLDPSLDTFAAYCRVRLLSFQLYLDNVPNTVELLAMKIRMTDSMLDLLPRELSGSTMTSRIGHYITTDSVCNFEFSPADREVVLQGRLGDEHALSLMSPFRTWEIEVAGTWSLADVDGLQLEMLCQVTPI